NVTVLDAINPTITLTAPAPGATVNGTVPLIATASDNVGVTAVQFTIDGTNVGGAVATAPYTVNWDSTTVANGPHTVGAKAFDAAGNVGTSSLSVSVNNPDTTPPTVSMASPANNANVKGTVTVTANASDNVGVASVQFLLDNVNLGNPVTAAPYSI